MSRGISNISLTFIISKTIILILQPTFVINLSTDKAQSKLNEDLIHSGSIINYLVSQIEILGKWSPDEIFIKRNDLSFARGIKSATAFQSRLLLNNCIHLVYFAPRELKRKTRPLQSAITFERENYKRRDGARKRESHSIRCRLPCITVGSIDVSNDPKT